MNDTRWTVVLDSEDRRRVIGALYSQARTLNSVADSLPDREAHRTLREEAKRYHHLATLIHQSNSMSVT